MTPVVGNVRSAIKVTTGYGRLYVSGPDYRQLLSLPGATENQRRRCVELSLTLDTFRAIKRAMRYTSQQLASCCTDEVMQWATAAAKMEKAVNAVHDQLATGWRRDLPWEDASGRGRNPFDHQKVMSSVATSLDGCAFLAVMGLGKSRSAIQAIRFMLDTDQLDVVLTICPKGVLRTWQDQMEEWAPGYWIEVLTGTKNERAQELKMWKPTKSYPKVLALNYDVVDALKGDLQRFMQQYRVGLVLDEMHKVKNPDAKRSKAILVLAQFARWRLGMTGSPVLQGIQDVWSQWYTIDLGITFGANYVQYRREFLTEDPYSFSLDPKEGALDEVGARMRRRGLRYTKEECLDLPPKLYEKLEVDLTTDQWRAYHQMEAELVAWLRDQNGDEATATAANQLAAMLRLTQITSGFVPDEFGVIHRFNPNPKLQTLEDIVRAEINNQQIIVWCRYTEDIARIAECLRDLQPAVIAGDPAVQEAARRSRLAMPKRADVESLFQRGERRLIVANPAAGGLGLNLWRGSLAIYYSQGYSLENRIQSEDRCHRAGSEIHQHVTYIDLVAEGTIDEIIVGALLGKKHVADVVVDLRRALGV